jgi:glucokinase
MGSAREAPGEVGLVADIGGTNARFALTDAPFDEDHVKALKTAEFPGLADAARAYLDLTGARTRPRSAAIAVASPITGDRVEMTNNAWSFSIAALERTLDLDRLEVVNDFAAIAYAVPHLGERDSVGVGTGKAIPGEPIGVIGPGTGLGVAALVPVCRDDWIALASEGGHVTMAATDDREAAVISALRRRVGHVSAERVLSGPGLVNLYRTLADLDGHPPESLNPAEVSERALGESCPISTQALELFTGMLGNVAGNLALTLAARGGIYIGGGIVPRLGSTFAISPFRHRFEDKGRFRAYLSTIPTRVILHAFPALVGLKGLLAKSVTA